MDWEYLWPGDCGVLGMLPPKSSMLLRVRRVRVGSLDGCLTTLGVAGVWTGVGVGRPESELLRLRAILLRERDMPLFVFFPFVPANEESALGGVR